MNDKLKIPYPVIVEGKYDKLRLSSVIEAQIIATDGFGIFKNHERAALLRSLARKTPLIVLTDPDGAGRLIRSHISGILPKDKIICLHIPKIEGKEKRKDKGSKEGFLGVEGMKKQVIIDALEKSGAIKNEISERERKITKTDMFVSGLSGGDGAAEKRKSLLRFLELPQNLSSSALLDILNTYFSYDEFGEMIKKWQKEETKN